MIKKENNFWKTSEQLHKIYKVILITLFLLDDYEYDLIYLDPPFFTQRTHKMEKDGKEILFEDIWDSEKDYNDWLYNVFISCFNKLSKRGIIYSHNNFQINSMLFAGLEDKIKKRLIYELHLCEPQVNIC